MNRRTSHGAGHGCDWQGNAQQSGYAPSDGQQGDYPSVYDGERRNWERHQGSYGSGRDQFGPGYSRGPGAYGGGGSSGGPGAYWGGDYANDELGYQGGSRRQAYGGGDFHGRTYGGGGPGYRGQGFSGQGYDRGDGRPSADADDRRDDGYQGTGGPSMAKPKAVAARTMT
jgi:hypothetical protein